jgi:hypothetical protein
MKQPDPVKEAQRILINGDQSLFGTLPVVIKNMIEDQCWLTHTKQDGSSFTSFRELVEYKLWWGLETPYDDLVYFCRKDTECVRMLEENRGELPTQEIGKGKPGPGRGKTDDNVNRLPAQGGNSSDYTKRRLKRDRPDLYEKVISGDMTANAAAIEAGFRKPSPPPIRTPESALDAITVALKADSRISAVCELLNALSPAEFRAVQTWLAKSRAA